jgi:glycosyltransferase involved in cell wall biosynthesis
MYRQKSQRMIGLARRVYHALPLSEPSKIKLRRWLVPYLNASIRITDGQNISQVLSQVVELRRQLRWNGKEETAFQRALIRIATQNQEYGPITHFIVLPFLATGGAERVALNFAQAIKLCDPNASVLLIIADRAAVSAQVTQPSNISILMLDSVFDEPPSYEQKQALLEALIRSICPRVVHNINSEVAWQMILSRGEVLSPFTNLFASIFAFQFAPDGKTKIGYAAYFLRAGLPYLKGLFSDNKRFIQDAAIEYNLSQAEKTKLHPIYNPVRTSTDHLASTIEQRLDLLAKSSRTRRLRVLWAGRLDREKRVDILYELIKQVDYADFDIYGQAVVDGVDPPPALSNVHYKGAFSDPEDLIRHATYDAFVFTSRWEGMPNILLEIGSFGVPIIAPTVGGVGELISSHTGYPLPEKAQVNDYVDALQNILNHPEEAAARSKALQYLVQKRHSWDTFLCAIKSVPEYVDQ